MPSGYLGVIYPTFANKLGTAFFASIRTACRYLACCGLVAIE
jgi:hypothetical protein